MSVDKELWLSTEIKKRYGSVRRSRGCYLYTEKGVRLTDCSLDNGRAILGWDGGKARTVFKDTFERGMCGTYDGGYSERLSTAVKHLLPKEYTEIKWWFNKPNNSIESVLWRPWIDICAKTEPSVTRYDKVTVFHPDNLTDIKGTSTIEYVKEKLPESIVLIPPFPWINTPVIYAYKESVSEPSDIVSAPLLAAMTRAFFDLKTALGEYSENDFKRFTKQLSPYFIRKACWLFPKVDKEVYRDFVLKCLDVGIVLSPDYNIPSIVPWKANPGDIGKIANAACLVNI